MQLTKHTDYALRVLMYLAHSSELSTIRQIAEAYDISQNHLMKIVHQLAKNGFVEAVRGKRGGLKLARAPALINIGDVVRRTEETLNVLDCLSADYDGECRIACGCRLKGVLGGAQNAFLTYLDAYHLDQLMSASGTQSTEQWHRVMFRRGSDAQSQRHARTR